MKLSGYLLEMFRSELEDAVGVNNVISSVEERLACATDQLWLTHMWAEKGEELPIPDFIVRPLSTMETARVLKICNTHKVAVTPRGGGSGTQGGAATPYGGVVLDLGRMNKILRIDESSLVLTAQPGINGRVLETHLNERGFMLAHYPSSVDMATLGGYLAARGSGVMSTKYGKPEDMVLSIQVVLPDGKVISTLPTPNHASGPGLLQLFIGSEGTLGVITEISIRIDPLPEVRRFRVIQFPSVRAGLEAGRQIMTKRLDPTVIRLYDEAATLRSLTATGHDLRGVNMVLMTDGVAAVADLQMAQIIELCILNRGRDLGELEGQHWWEHRYDFYRPPLQPEFPLLYGTVETVTTYSNLERLYEAKRDLIIKKYSTHKTRYTAHFSHWYPWGAMIYDRFYIDSPPDSAQEMFRLHNQIWADCVRINLAHGAVINEHHGVGLKLGWLMGEGHGAAFDTLRAIKVLLDPKCVMNPGKLGFGVW